MRTLIEPTTDAKVNKIFIPDDRFISVAHDGLAGIEKISFQIELNGTFVAIIPAVEMTAAGNYIQIAGPNTYKVLKDATVASVGVYIN